MTASLAMRKTFLRRPRNPLAALSTFLCAARAVTPRLTLGMARLLVGQHRLQGALVGWMGRGRAAQMTLALLGLLREDVAQVRAAALELAAGELLETLRRAALGFEFRHGLLLFSYSAGRSARRLVKPGQLLLVGALLAH